MRYVLKGNSAKRKEIKRIKGDTVVKWTSGNSFEYQLYIPPEGDDKYLKALDNVAKVTQALSVEPIFVEGGRI